MNLALGCPIFEREWIFDRWADSVEAQVWPDGTDVSMKFVYTPGDDDTFGAITRRFPDAEVWTTDSETPAYRNTERSDQGRYRLLADLRNNLLSMAVWSNADYLLSWDSDMIFEPDTLGRLFIDEPVAGALADMTGEDWLMDEGHGFPSWMWLDGQKAWREEGWSSAKVTDPFKVGVAMGVVLIRRDVLESPVEYQYHPQGEDIGFAMSCRQWGFEQWLVPSARAEHVRHRPDRPKEEGA